MVYPIVYGATHGGSAVANNYGNTTAKPIITFYGPMENPVLTNDVVGKFLRLNLTVASGQRVVINTATPSIVQGSLTATPSDNRMGSRATGSVFGALNQARTRYAYAPQPMTLAMPRWSGRTLANAYEPLHHYHP